MVGDVGAPETSWNAGHPQDDLILPARRPLLEDRRQLRQGLESEPWWADVHSGAGDRIAHPARHLTPSPWLVLDQDDIEAPAACALADAKPSAE
jgi:hypothetical protein